jgi:hypothetical protein
MKSRLIAIFYSCLVASSLMAQESQPSSQPVLTPTSAPTSSPTSTATSQPTSIRVLDPWSGSEVKLAELDPRDLKSPRKAHMLAWLSFGGGLSLAAIGGGILVGVEAGKSIAPSLALLGIGGVASAIGPSLGHFYAGETKRARRQSLASLAVLGGAAGLAFSIYQLGAPLEDQPARITMTLLPITAAGAYQLRYAVLMAEDAPLAVKRSNEKRARQLSLAPNGFSLQF